MMTKQALTLLLSTALLVPVIARAQEKMGSRTKVALANMLKETKRFETEAFMTSAQVCEPEAEMFINPLFSIFFIDQAVDGRVDLNSCLDNRKIPDRLGMNSPIDGYPSPEDYLRQDQAICQNCMSKLSVMKWHDQLEKQKNSPEYKKSNISSNVERIGNKLQAQINGMGLQAALLSDNEEEGLAFTMTTLEKVKADENSISKAVSTLKDYPGQQNKLRQMFSPEFDKRILTEEAGKSCISYKTYLTYTQSNPSEEFHIALNESKKFDPSDWDYNKLKEAYNQAVRLSGDGSPEAMAEKKLIEAKLKFLYMNPMIKNLFSAHNSKDLDPKRVRQKQEELFGHLKKNLGKPDYRDGLKKFFHGSKKDSDALVFARTMANEELMKEYDKVINKPDILMSEALPQDALALNDHLKAQTGLSTSDCWFESDNKEKCREIFEKYCPLVERALDVTTPKLSYADSLELEFQKSMAFKPEEDEGYQKLSKRICESTYVNKQGNLSTFAEFKTKNCGGKEDGNACLAKFMESFPTPAFHSEYDTDRVETFRTTFVTHLKSYKEWTTTEDKADQVVDNYVALDDLRDHLSKNWGKTISGIMNNEPESEKKRSVRTEGLLTRTLSSVIDPIAGSSEPGVSSDDALMNYGLGSSTALTDSSAVAEVRQKQAEAEKELAKTEDQIEAANAKLARTSDSNEKLALQQEIELLKARQKMMEQTTQEYQRLLDQYSSKLAQNNGEKAGAENSAQGAAAPVAGSSASRTSVHLPVSSSEVGESGVNRNIASVGENSFGPMLPVAGGATLGGNFNGASNAGGSRLNDVMKAKYGITIMGGGEGQVVVAAEQASDNISALLDSGHASVPAISVPRDEFERLKGHDVDTLKEIYEERIKELNTDIVKITIVPDTLIAGELRELEFYAIREGNQIVFQPVRKNKLQDLRNNF